MCIIHLCEHIMCPAAHVCMEGCSPHALNMPDGVHLGAGTHRRQPSLITFAGCIWLCVRSKVGMRSCRLSGQSTQSVHSQTIICCIIAGSKTAAVFSTVTVMFVGWVPLAGSVRLQKIAKQSRGCTQCYVWEGLTCAKRHAERAGTIIPRNCASTAHRDTHGSVPLHYTCTLDDRP